MKTLWASNKAGGMASKGINDTVTGINNQRKLNNKKDYAKQEYDKIRENHPEMTNSELSRMTSKWLEEDDIDRVSDEFKPYANAIFMMRDQLKDMGSQDIDKDTKRVVQQFRKQ